MYQEVKINYGSSTKSVHAGTAQDPVTNGFKKEKNTSQDLIINYSIFINY
jgi:hypothetical protein